jgi:hypothetical protein
MAELGNIHISQPHQVDSSVIRWRLDTEEAIRQLENRFLGRMVDERGQWKDTDDPSLKWCNQKGVAFARTFLGSIISKNTIQGNINIERQMRLMGDIARTLVVNVGKSYKEYGIPIEKRDSYIDTILHHIELTLSRSIDDMERQHVSTTTKESSTFAQQLQGMNPGLGHNII